MDFYFSHKAEKQLGALPRHIQRRIRDKMIFYASQENPFLFAKKLIDRDGYRFRIGNYRALFIVENDTIKIVKIESRDKVYE
jgi:mRNA interferase RelE/StbE